MLNREKKVLNRHELIRVAMLYKISFGSIERKGKTKGIFMKAQL